jgi:ADP-ribosylation factor GTPase-activating protein 2/3
MYFERGGYDPAAAAEAQERLRSFQGATAISSNAYFGREEDEHGEDGGPGGGGGGEGMLGDANLENIQASARDAIQRVMANPDVQNAAESIRQGALKVRRPIPSLCADMVLTVSQLSDYLAAFSER